MYFDEDINNSQTKKLHFPRGVIQKPNGKGIAADILNTSTQRVASCNKQTLSDDGNVWGFLLEDTQGHSLTYTPFSQKSNST